MCAQLQGIKYRQHQAAIVFGKPYQTLKAARTKFGKALQVYNYVREKWLLFLWAASLQREEKTTASPVGLNLEELPQFFIQLRAVRL